MRATKLTKETISQLGISERNFPDFTTGDTIAVVQKIKEGDKERLQVFQGDVIAFHENGISTTFTVRKIGANAVAVEKIFPYYSPVIESITFVKKGDVRRAKLYYLRDRLGKSARIKERIVTREQKEQKEAASENK